MTQKDIFGNETKFFEKASFFNGAELTGNIVIDGNLRINGSPYTPYTPIWSVGGSNIYYTNGNVGIGTNDPGRLLSLFSASGDPFLSLKSNSSNTPGILFGDTDSDSIGQIRYYNNGNALAFETNGAERLRIDSGGNITKPYQLWIAGSPSNTTGSGIFNSFNTSIFANPVGLSFATDRITVPIAGVYMITFNSICDSSSVRKDSLILINGSTISSQLSENSTAGYHYRSASLAVKLAANDYIQFSNDDWYDVGTSSTTWRTASVYLLG